ncbi:hypothetical protein [Paenibacillus sp. UASWS1643]|uniref:hypothetical protein n=1 Tax=Paenibacillus sp. UASWS1643 TaxID=2580422 RepID=UPI00123A0DDE|nr:hypothetical protein [Paenibacillus sp. UASWS1643]KAA8750071.1 hypothetical protein FE296_15850 [Paenibacillus sp. UASWS1643]
MSQVAEDKSKPYLTPLIKRIRAHILTSGTSMKSISAKAGIPEKRFYRLMDGTSMMSADEVELLCKIEGLELDPKEIFLAKNS